MLNEKGEREIESRLWGFVIRWKGKRDPDSFIEKLVQSAVSETIETKATFSGAWKKNHRCVIPAINFLEPKDKKFVPIHDPKLPMLSIAGIWNEMMYKGEKQSVFTMLTCEPNSFVEKFHDRMPVILNPDDIDEWLSPDTTPEQAKHLCRPYQGQLKFAGQ